MAIEQYFDQEDINDMTMARFLNLSDQLGTKLVPGNYMYSIDEKGETISLPNSIAVRSYDAEGFVENQNKRGVSATDIKTLAPSYGTLKPFIDEATQILDSVYASTSEPTQRGKDINMGRAALKFFTTLGAQSSVPGATALGAANQAGALVAQDYLNAETKRESDAKTLAQSKKSTALSLGMQLKSADDAKEIAVGKKKTK